MIDGELWRDTYRRRGFVANFFFAALTAAFGALNLAAWVVERPIVAMGLLAKPLPPLRYPALRSRAAAAV